MVSSASGLPWKCKRNKLECWNIINYICRDVKVLESWKQVVVVLRNWFANLCRFKVCIFLSSLFCFYPENLHLPSNRDTALNHRLNRCSFGVECFSSQLWPQTKFIRRPLGVGVHVVICCVRFYNQGCCHYHKWNIKHICVRTRLFVFHEGNVLVILLADQKIKINKK